MELTEERLVVHVPRGTTHAIEQAAIHARLKPSELARDLVLYGLEIRGVTIEGQNHD